MEETRKELEKAWTARINKFMELYEMVPEGIEWDLRFALAHIQAVVGVAARDRFK